MTHFYTRRNIIIGFVVCLLLISFFAYYSYRDLRKVENESREVTFLIKSLTTVDDVLDDMLNIETAQRGYVISGDEEYLEPFYNGVSKLEKDSIELKRIASRYPVQARIYSELLRLMKLKLEFAQHVVQLRRDSGYLPALQLVQSDRGRIYMDSIRTGVTSVESQNREMLTVMNNSREKHAQSTASLFTILAVLSLLILFILFYLIFRGVRQRDKYEKQIAYLASLTENTSDGVMSLDLEGNIISWNRGAEQIYGYSRQEVIGKFAPAVTQSGVTPGQVALLQEALKKKTSEVIEVMHYSKTGKPIYCLASTTALKNEQGKVTGFVTILRDISDRKKLEEQLRRFNTELTTQVDLKTTEVREVMDRMSDGVFALDNNWKFTYVNRKAEEIAKQPAGSLLGKRYQDLYPRSMDSSFFKACELAIETQQYQYGKDFFEPFNAWLETHIYPSLSGLSIYVRDITEKKQAEEALVISEERYKTLVEQAGDAIAIFDAKGQVQDVNNSATQLLGYSKDELRKLNLADILTREELAQHPVRFDILDQGTVTIRQRNMHRKDGTVIRTEVNTKKLSNGLFIALVRDLTEREKAEHEIRELQRQFSSFMETLPARAWIVDEKGIFHYMNSLFQEITGGKNLTGKNFHDVLPPEMVKLQQESNEIVFKTNDVLTLIEPSVNAQGRKAIYQVFKFPLGLSKGVKMLGGIALDITEQYKSQESMKKLNEQLAVSNRELEQFAYVASHDLQEPLRMVSSFLGLLKKKYAGYLDETAQEYIHFAVDGADRMKVLISDLLNFSRVGSSKLVFTDVDTSKLLDTVLTTLQALTRETGVSILVSPLPVVHADATQLGQLFQNLIVNAIKYRGPVDPSISVGCVEREREWEFSIRDNGIGFDKANAKKIFTIFQRLHTRKEYSGTGIGLAICKKIVERHGGKIWVDSLPGQGSTFYFTLVKNG